MYKYVHTQPVDLFYGQNRLKSYTHTKFICNSYASSENVKTIFVNDCCEFKIKQIPVMYKGKWDKEETKLTN